MPEGCAHVLVLNQHGNNRGDEAAFRAMFAGIEERAPVPVRFTVLHQFRGEVSVEVPQEVRWISLVPPISELPAMIGFALGLAAGVRLFRLLGRWGRDVVEAYRTADVAVSAPGGPYFGDIYADHEPLHWFYVWMADRYDLPLMLYAPSVGPFDNRARNLFRRRVFQKFDEITVREEVSLEHLKRLLGGRGPTPILVSDSALQRCLDPITRSEYFGPQRAHLADRFLVGVSALQWSYPQHPDPDAAHARYEDVLLDTLGHVGRRRRAHFLLVPQLFGGGHSDVPYLESLASRLPSETSWEVVDPTADSDHQQRVFGMTDMYVACRYHPQIFAVSSGVPGVCIYYQHKALGFLVQLGLERLAFPIGALDPGAVRVAADEVLDRREELSREIQERLPSLRRASARSSQIAARLLREAGLQVED